MKVDIKSLTQIYNLVSLSIPVMMIVALVYDVCIWLKAAKIQVHCCVLWGVIEKVYFRALWSLTG